MHLLTALLRNWKTVAMWPLLCGLAAAVIIFVVPARYTAHASFVVESEEAGGAGLGGLGGLAGLAGLAGITLPAQGADGAPFQASVLRSRAVQLPVLEHRYAKAAQDDGPGTLFSVLTGDAELDEWDRDKAIVKFNRLLTVRTDDVTGIVSVAYQTSDPELAADVVTRILDELMTFNVLSRTSEARRLREFLEERYEVNRGALTGAENDLRLFLEQNREWNSSPALSFEEGRLQRVISIHQEVFSSLSRELETARIDEVNDIAAITIIDVPIPPSRPDFPQPLLSFVVAGILGLLVGMVHAFAIASWPGVRTRHAESLGEFKTAWLSLPLPHRRPEE